MQQQKTCSSLRSKLSTLLLLLVVLAIACLGTCHAELEGKQQLEQRELGTMVGGWTDVTNSNDAEKESSVQWAIKQLKESNGVSPSDHISVVSVKAQGDILQSYYTCSTWSLTSQRGSCSSACPTPRCIMTSTTCPPSHSFTP